MRSSLALLAAAAVIVGAPAQAQFALDLDRDSFVARRGVFTIGDLAVGERAYARWPFCIEDGQLFISQRAVIDRELSGYGRRHLVSRLPGNRVSVEVEVGPQSRSTLREELLNVVEVLSFGARGSQICDVPINRRLPVESINGHASLSDLLDEAER